ncbi:hypothetical protein V5O48_013748 [Marasmius crinis-equi]|uniref:Uncharacterized protein n=1 Tax=Marasmius crinis-equi TaxID=585013 RepID=A0ABR3EZ79_9AGAR
MPAQKIFVGQRAKFFEDRKALYAEAVKNDTKKDFLSNAQREFFNRWPPLLPLSVELDQATLDAIDDNTVSAEYPVPVESELGAEEYKKKKQEYDEYRKKLEERKGQIVRRFKADWEEDNTRTSRDPNDPWNLLLLRLNGTLDSKKPRLQPAVNVWYQENKTLVKASLDKKKKPDDKRKHTDAPNAYMSEARKIFGKLDAAVQKEWQDKAAALHKTALEEWDAMLRSAPSTEPADRQRCINRLVRFVKPILDGIAERMGFVVSLIAGGPEPQDSGRLNCISVHSGTTPGDVKMDWARAELPTFKKHIFPSVARFCKRVYTVEECRSRALPTVYEEEGEEEEGIEETEAHVFGADLEEVTEDGVDLYPVKAGAGVGTGGKARNRGEKKDNPTNPVAEKAQPASEKRVAGTSASRVVETAKRPSVGTDSKAHTEHGTEEQANTNQATPTQPRRGLRPRKLVSRSSPVHPARSASSSPSRSPSPYSGIKPARLRARGRMTVSSPIRHLESPAGASLATPGASQAAAETLALPFPRHASLPPSLPPSPTGTPTRTPTQAPVTTSPIRDVPESSLLAAAPPPRNAHDAEETEDLMEIEEEWLLDQDVGSSPRTGRKRRVSGEQGGSRSKKARAVGSDSGKGDDEVMEDDSTRVDVGSRVDEAPVLPESVPDYVACTYELATKDESKAIPGFDRLLSRWLGFEEKEGYWECPCLKTTGRPKWVGLWFGRHRNPEYVPPENALEVLDKFWGWWQVLQPEWRDFGTNGRPIPEAYE